MTQALPKLVTFSEFIDWYPKEGMRYELHDGGIVEMAPSTGEHENIIGFLAEKITLEYTRVGLSYRIPKTGFVKPPLADSAYLPDILLLNLDNLINEPLWKKSSTISQAKSVSLLVEVVSSNWAR